MNGTDNKEVNFYLIEALELVVEVDPKSTKQGTRKFTIEHVDVTQHNKLKNELGKYLSKVMDKTVDVFVSDEGGATVVEIYDYVVKDKASVYAKRIGDFLASEKKKEATRKMTDKDVRFTIVNITPQEKETVELQIKDIMTSNKIYKPAFSITFKDNMALVIVNKNDIVGKEDKILNQLNSIV